MRQCLYYYAKNVPNRNKERIAEGAAKLKKKKKKFVMMPFFPMYSFDFPRRIYHQIIRLHNKRNYDLVVSVFSPFDSTVAGYWFKKKYQGVKWCLYSLDTFINQRYNFLNQKGNTHNFWLPRFLDKCDMFIYMRSREKEYADSYFDKWRSKMKPADIPLMVKEPNEMNSNHQNEVEQWVYAGSLGAPHYITDDLIDIFMGLNDGKKRELHFYSSGDSFEKLKAVNASAQSKVICHPYVAHNELMKVYKNADVLVSIKYSDQISAKIFEYMTYGKKIVHVSGTKDDPNVQYLFKYSRGIVIEPYKYTTDKCIVKLLSELYSLNGKETDLSYFEMNRPEYTKELILRCVQ